MPELPEVETTKSGLTPHLVNKKMKSVLVHERRFRWPVSENIETLVEGNKVLAVDRRSKYLLIRFKQGTLMFHLGMSGSLRIESPSLERKKHDHIEILINSKKVLRFNDARRFGACLWYECEDQEHELLRHLAPEPLTGQFNTAYFIKKAHGRNQNIKSFIMDASKVVGVGNIYANESLFKSKIHPLTKTKDLNEEQCKTLVNNIKSTLKKSIKQGGTTLKDFVNGDGKPGYFQQTLKVYGREKMPCTVCQTELVGIKISQRATVFCPQCQPIPED